MWLGHTIPVVEVSFKAKHIIASIMDSIQKIESFGFHVSMIIVDGASANLSMIRLLTLAAPRTHLCVHSVVPRNANDTLMCRQVITSYLPETRVRREGSHVLLYNSST